MSVGPKPEPWIFHRNKWTSNVETISSHNIILRVSTTDAAGFLTLLPADRKLVYVEIFIKDAPDQCDMRFGVGRDPGLKGHAFNGIGICRRISLYCA